MHHIFTGKTENCAWRGDACDETGVCNVFAEWKIPHPCYPRILCGASGHAFQIRLSEKSVTVFRDRFMPEFPDAAFQEWLESENLGHFLEIWRKR